MNNTFKRINIAALVLALLIVSACTHERSNRVLKGYGDNTLDNPEIDPDQTEDDVEIAKEREKIAELAKKNHGLMHIHRYGPGFDVLLTLDAGDSDVSFSMKMPKVKDREQQESEQQELDQESAEELHEEIAEKGEEVEQGQADQYNSATKYVVAAQTLFYKKQYWKALDEVNEALKLAPSSAQSHALKGSIYYKMGLKKDAQVSWKKALEIDPEMADVKESLNKLGGI